MKVTITVTRTFEMNETRVLTEPDFEPPARQTEIEKVRAWLQESFYELCGFWREQDHLDGSYVRLIEDDSEAEWDWPEALT